MKIWWLRSLTESRVHVGHYLVVVLRLVLAALVLTMLTMLTMLTVRMRLAGRMSSTLLLMLWLVWLMLWLVLWLALILLVSFINVCLVLMLDRVWRVLLLLIKVF